MPQKSTIARARKAARPGKSPSNQAGEFVRKVIHAIRQGKQSARHSKQAIAIDLPSKPKRGKSVSASTQSRKTSASAKSKNEPRSAASRSISSPQTRKAAAKKGTTARSAASRRAAALKAARTRKRQAYEARV